MGRAILALDLGAETGWGLRHPNSRVDSGFWKLTPAKHQGEDLYFRNLRARLFEVKQRVDFAGDHIGEVRFEGVDFASPTAGVYAAHMWGGYKATLITWCGQLDIPYRRIAVATLKKAATGNHQAKKPDVIRAVNERLHLRVVNDNEADALALLLVKDLAA